MPWRRIAYLSSALVLVVLFFWVRSGKQTAPSSEPAAPQSAEEAQFATQLANAPFGLLGVRFYESFEGKKRWNIQSRFAELHRKENYAFLEDVAADFFSEKTGNRIQTKSKYGRSRIDQQKIDLEGNVSIHSKRGYLFEMDRLSYDGSSHEFNTEDTVSMKGPSVAAPTMTLKGTGLVGNIDTEHFLVKNNVTALRKLKSNEWLKITSRSGEFFTEEQRAVFVGGVKAAMPRVSIDSDIFELSVSEETEAILARGNVMLKQRDMVGRAESAGMEIGSSRIVLEGNAQIESKSVNPDPGSLNAPDAKHNRISGRRIVVYTDEDRIEVESAEGSVQ